MVKVAVAGGTGGLGRTVTEAILATKKHEVFVLTRQDSVSKVFAYEPAITVLKIDYTSPETIAAVLKNNNIDTVISCVNLQSDEAGQAQLNLIEGAAISKTVRRFAPGEFGLDYMEASRQNFTFPFASLKVSAIAKLRDIPSLNYTRFINGTFMDYLGPAHAPSYLPIINLLIDIKNNKAVVPGTGNVPLVLTHTTDVGRFVAEALSLEEWPEASYIVGDKITVNELVETAEKLKGVKFDVAHDTVEDLRVGKNSELPSNVPLYAILPKPMIDGIFQNVGLAIEGGWLNFNVGVLNELLPSVMPMSVKEFWKKYQEDE